MRISLQRLVELPDDIGRLVCERAAEDGAGPSLALVSKKVQSWVDPIIYSKIELSSSNTPLLCRTFQDESGRKGPAFFATHVKTLVVAFILSIPPELLALIKACRAVETFVIWSTVYTPEDVQELFARSSLAPTRLAINAIEFAPEQRHLSYPILQSVTHLDVVWNHDDRWTWDSLIHLSNLTHLSFDIRSENGAMVRPLHQVITASPPSLRVVVVWVYPSYYKRMAGELDDIKAIFEGEVDLRAVVAYLGTLKEGPGWQPDYVNLLRVHEDVLRDWGEIRDGEDFWAEAEQTIQKRRRRLAAGHSPHQNILQ